MQTAAETVRAGLRDGGGLMTARATKRSRSAQGGKMKRVFDAIAVLTALASLSCARAFAEPYPSHLVRLMVPASAGGVTDLVARITGDYLSARTNQRFIIENRTGAGG